MRLLKANIDAFVEKSGRRPRMLVCKMGQDGSCCAKTGIANSKL